MKRGILVYFGAVEQAGAVAAAAERHQLRPIAVEPCSLLFAGEALPVRSMPDGGIVVGDIFSRSGATMESSREGWGNYLAFASDGLRRTVDRAPLTGMPLYWTRHGSGIVCASHLALLGGILPPPSIDWEFISHALLFINLRTDRTGLLGLSELLPGTQLAFDGATAEIKSTWSPWDHTPVEKGVQDHARELERRILRSVAALAGSRPEIAIELSGGLDSSIVAASLRAAGANFSGITFATSSADGDERHFAEAVAARCGVDLAVIQHGDEEIDLIAPPDILLPRPGAYSVLGGIDRAFATAYAERDISIFGGIGGDSVFDLDGSVAPILDALGQFGFGRRTFGTVRDVARAGNATIWTALRLTARARRNGRRVGGRRDPKFLNVDGLPGLQFPHPWDAGEATAPQARINHVQAIRYILDFLDRPARWHGRDVVAPLLSQPVVEYCLSIPSWTWFTGGRNRAVARAAFAARLPAEVVWRRDKGRLESMCSAAYLRQRPQLRDLLLGGRLAEQGLLDGPAIDAYLSRDLVEGDFDYFRLIEIGDVERWVRAVESGTGFGPSFDQR